MSKPSRSKTIVCEQHFLYILHFLELVQQGLPLNLAGVNGYCGHMEAHKPRNAHGIQLGSIEPTPYRRKDSSQCSMNRSFCRSAECLRRVRISQPHKVPANATNSRVQLRCHGAHRLCPSLGKWLLAQNDLIRKDTSIPQEDRVYLHRCRLPGSLSNRLRPDSDPIGIGAETALGEE